MRLYGCCLHLDLTKTIPNTRSPSVRRGEFSRRTVPNWQSALGVYARLADSSASHVALPPIWTAASHPETPFPTAVSMLYLRRPANQQNGTSVCAPPPGLGLNDISRGKKRLMSVIVTGDIEMGNANFWHLVGRWGSTRKVEPEMKVP